MKKATQMRRFFFVVLRSFVQLMQSVAIKKIVSNRFNFAVAKLITIPRRVLVGMLQPDFSPAIY